MLAVTKTKTTQRPYLKKLSILTAFDSDSFSSFFWANSLIEELIKAIKTKRKTITKSLGRNAGKEIWRNDIPQS
ncbi:MAG: hypothetical protein COX63_00335 [Candidatus Diapherotrites archaeon CG_4_10_14_0_2_um_filter_31_5]|nr:MAG: hypothetical protein COX63_00335 [Candidatus Diapherotrites archaeon CG_4_10_14_0_2_um_filter_31_5]